MQQKFWNFVANKDRANVELQNFHHIWFTFIIFGFLCWVIYLCNALSFATFLSSLELP